MRNGNQIGVCLAGCIFMAWVCAASGQATRTWDNGVGTRRYAKAILVGALILVGLAVWGITRVVINDNPVKWFNDKHPIRIADRVMNSHFGGTYMGYLSLSPSDELPGPGKLASEVEVTLQARQAELASDAMTGVDEVFGLLLAKARELDASAESREAFFAQWQDYAAEQMDAAQDEMFDAWESASLFVGEQAQAGQVFKDPAVLNWMAGLQDHLLTIKSPDGRPIVGKSNSLADLVRTVHRELMEGNPEYYRIPDRREGVAQTVLQYESSHRPQDLAHFVRTDTWRRTSMWIQQKSGDNRDMKVIVDSVDGYIAANPPPAGIQAEWVACAQFAGRPDRLRVETAKPSCFIFRYYVSDLVGLCPQDGKPRMDKDFA